MDVNKAREVLDKCLANQDAKSIALKGPWGAGKTHLWTDAVSEAAVAGHFNRYAYVSLFGLNSMKEVREAIFQNAMSVRAVAHNATTGMARSAPSPSVVDKLTSAFGETNIKRLLKLLEPLNQSASEALKLTAFTQIQDYVICIDDLERRGKGVDLADVLGLINFLKEERNCRVFTILNEDALGDTGDGSASGRQSLERMREKVFDLEIHFIPNATERAAIALQDREEIRGWVEPAISELGITNMRILQRIVRAVEDFKPFFQNYDLLAKQATRSIALFCWAYYAKGPQVPPYAMLRSRWTADGEDDASVRDSYTEWEPRLMAYGYRGLTDFEDIVGDYIENGYIASVDRLRATLRSMTSIVDGNASYKQFSAALRALLDGPDTDVPGLTKNVETASRKAIRHIGIYEMDGLIRFLITVDKKTLAEDLAKRWSDSHIHETLGRTFNLQTVFREAIRKARAEYRQVSGAFETIVARTPAQAPSAEEMSTLASASVADYIRYFDSALPHGYNNALGPIVETVTKFLLKPDPTKKTSDPTAGRKVRANLQQSLEEIAKRGSLERARIAPYLRSLA